MLNRLRRKAPGLVVLFLLACLAVPALAAGKPAYLGFQVHALWYERSNSEMQRELDLVQQSGANTVRVDVGWSSLETEGKGDYTGWYLDKLDGFVRSAGERGLKVIPTLAGTPCWASTAPDTLKQGCEGRWWDRGVQNYPPANANDFGDAARFLTSRYGSQLAALEIWNEPNTERFLIAPNRASAYAALVKAAYPAAKAGNPGVPVIVGALAAADRPFLDELYAQGIQGSYDGISVHPYNEWRDPYDRWQDKWKKYTFLPGIEWVHEGQVAAGDATPLWVTEFGWDTCVGHEWCVDEAQQADYTVKALQILNGFDFVAGATGYELRDESTDRTDFESNWGLVRQDFSPKPAFAAVSAQLHGQLEEATVTLTIQVADDGTVYAVGKAPQKQNLAISLNRCPKKQARLLKATSQGRYRRKLGFVKRLRGCRVTVRMPQTTRTASRTVPAIGSPGVSAARLAS